MALSFLFVSALTGAPGSMLSQVGLTRFVRHADTFAHFAAFFLAGFFLVRALVYTLLPRRGLAVATSVTISLAIAVAAELLHHYVPGRSFEYSDMAANVAGVLVGTLLWPLCRRYRLLSPLEHR